MWRGSSPTSLWLSLSLNVFHFFLFLTPQFYVVLSEHPLPPLEGGWGTGEGTEFNLLKEFEAIKQGLHDIKRRVPAVSFPPVFRSTNRTLKREKPVVWVSVALGLQSSLCVCCLRGWFCGWRTMCVCDSRSASSALLMGQCQKCTCYNLDIPRKKSSLHFQ